MYCKLNLEKKKKRTTIALLHYSTITSYLDTSSSKQQASNKLYTKRSSYMTPRTFTMDVDGPMSMDVEMEDTAEEDHAMMGNNNVMNNAIMRNINYDHYAGQYDNPYDSATDEEDEDDEPPTPPPPVNPSPRYRRGSMSEEEERERRASIKAIMADKSISPQSRRRSIQHLMDGRRGSLGASSHSSVASGTSTPDPSDNEDESCSYGSRSSGPPPTIHTTPYGYDAHDENAVNEQIRRMEQSRPPCSHYERNCTMIAPCCGAAFGCRICHDDCPILPPKIEFSRRMHRSASLPSSFTTMEQLPHDTHHNIDRFAIKEIICRECFTRQSSKT